MATDEQNCIAKRYIKQFIASSSKVACLETLLSTTEDDLIVPLMYYLHERGDDELKKVFIVDIATTSSLDAVPILTSLSLNIQELICGCDKAPYQFDFMYAIIDALRINRIKVVEYLTQGVSSPVPQTRLESMKAITLLEYPHKPSFFDDIHQIANIIRLLADDPDRAVHLSIFGAILTFAERISTDDKQAMQAILLSALYDNDSEIQLEAAITLSEPSLRLDSIDPVRPLLSAADEDSQRAALFALDAIDDPAVVLELLHFARNDNAELARKASSILRWGQRQIIRQGLLDTRSYPDAAFRQLVVEYLACALEKEDTEPLIEMLDDPDEHVRWQAAESLGRITDQHFLLDKKRWNAWLKEYTAKK